MRDYLTLKQGIIPNIDKVYHTFKQYHHSKYDFPIQQIVEDIANYADYFARIAFLQEEDPDLKQAMRDINALKAVSPSIDIKAYKNEVDLIELQRQQIKPYRNQQWHNLTISKKLRSLG